MDSSRDTSLIRRLGRLIGRTVLTAAAVVVSVYVTQRRPAPLESRQTSADDPVSEETPSEDEAIEPPDAEAAEAAETSDENEGAEDDPAGEDGHSEGGVDESVDEPRTLEELTADELYPLAQRLNIAGRATMDHAQLVEALQAEGIHEVTEGELVGEEALTEGESEQSAESDDGPRSLEELTADELYPLAQRLNIAGRATMDHAQLVEALQAEGIHEVTDGELVKEAASAEDETAERADDKMDNEASTVRSLDELTADELYRMAQRLDIAGRSTMRKAQLVQALQAEGVNEAEF